MTPTEAGLLLQVRARQIVNLDNAVRHELESAGKGLAGMVRIGCVETNAAHALARWLRSSIREPKSRSTLPTATTSRPIYLKAHLDAGTIDAAVPLARETAVTTGMLEGLPLMRPHRHILRDAFEEWLANPPHA